MTRIPYDQTAKLLLDGVLNGAGRAEAQHEVSNDPQWIDVWFERDDDTKPLPPGLFGKMVTASCAFEVFHKALNVGLALDCLAKQLGVYRRRRRRLASTTHDVPTMWLIVPEQPQAVLTELFVEPLEGWPAGFYRMKVPALPLHLVAVGELPRVRETLVLRLLGASTVLRDALLELGTLPEAGWERVAAADVVGMLHSLSATAPALEDPDERAIVMTAMTTYEKIKEEGRLEGRAEGRQEGRAEGRQEGRAEGRQEGRAEGIKDLLLRQLTLRFGELPKSIVEQVAAADGAQLDRWGERLVTSATLSEVFGSE